VLRGKIQSGIVVLGTPIGNRVALIAAVTKDLSKTYHAGNIIKEVAKIVGGSGGGRPDMAQAGGKDAEKLPDALTHVFQIVQQCSETGDA
jgi:alanyl-tRNA synthetase